MIKQLLTVTVLFIFSLSVYADENPLQQKCVSAIMQEKSPGQDNTQFTHFANNACSCLLEKSPNGQVNDKKINKLCIFSGMLHVVTDDLDEKASSAEIMDACKSMVNVNNPKPTDDDMNAVNTFCQCAQPKLVDLFKQSNSMTDKQYDDGVNEIAGSCSAN